jgi:protein-disulfide isomerase
VSENNHERNRPARERIQRERQREKSREKRRRTLIVSAAVVGVLGLAAAIGVLAAGADKADKDRENAVSGPLLPPAGAQGADRLTIPVGASDAPSTLTVWEDFRCPVCAQYEMVMGKAIHELTASGQLKVDYQFATIIDGNMGGSGSLRAANAVACAQDAGSFTPYHDVLYRNQPPEPDDAFADNNRLIELAGKVPGLDTPAFRACVKDGKHDSWVSKSNTAFAEGGFRGTPTVLLNGESVFPGKGGAQISPENLKKWVAEANKGKPAGTRSPSPAPAP